MAEGSVSVADRLTLLDALTLPLSVALTVEVTDSDGVTVGRVRVSVRLCVADRLADRDVLLLTVCDTETDGVADRRVRVSVSLRLSVCDRLAVDDRVCDDVQEADAVADGSVKLEVALAVAVLLPDCDSVAVRLADREPLRLVVTDGVDDRDCDEEAVEVALAVGSVRVEVADCEWLEEAVSVNVSERLWESVRVRVTVAVLSGVAGVVKSPRRTPMKRARGQDMTLPLCPCRVAIQPSVAAWSCRLYRLEKHMCTGSEMAGRCSVFMKVRTLLIKRAFAEQLRRHWTGAGTGRCTFSPYGTVTSSVFFRKTM